jgi:hypothetical protein
MRKRIVFALTPTIIFVLSFFLSASPAKAACTPVCSVAFPGNSIVPPDSTLYVAVYWHTDCTSWPLPSCLYNANVYDEGGNFMDEIGCVWAEYRTGGMPCFTWSFPFFIPSTVPPGTYSLVVKNGICGGGDSLCSATFTVDPTAPPQVPPTGPPLAPGPCDQCGCNYTGGYSYCPACNNACERCINPESQGGIYPKGGSWTAFGCINTGEPQGFLIWILRFALGIGGGIAFLLIIIGGFQVIASGGNPENVKRGKDIITSAIIGLLFIIFSLFLMQLIGVKIFEIPGLG